MITIHTPIYPTPNVKTTVYPLVVKVLENGAEIVSYLWQGAELAEVAYPVEVVLPDHYFLGYGKLWGGGGE